MSRFVLISSLGVLALHPAFCFAQNDGAALSPPASKPQSTIARSSFASSQRDDARESAPDAHPALQSTQPSVARPATEAAPPQSAPVPNKSSLTTTVPGAKHNSVPAMATPTTQAALSPVAPSATGTAKEGLSVSLPIPANVAASQRVLQGGAPLGVPKAPAKAVTPAPLVARPKVLASREAMRQRTLLARMASDLDAAQPRLNRAQARMLESQRQLGIFTSSLRSAMLQGADEGGGSHPFARVAQRYIGTPYVWGGESARGFDCSGFIMRVMRDLGYKALPHSAAEQFRYGTPVARALLRPGDVVFFANTYKRGVSHVGIYLGRGRFIHAANSKVGTIISGINEPKWVEHYAGARRLVRNS